MYRYGGSFLHNYETNLMETHHRTAMSSPTTVLLVANESSLAKETYILMPKFLPKEMHRQVIRCEPERNLIVRNVTAWWEHEHMVKISPHPEKEVLHGVHFPGSERVQHNMLCIAFHPHQSLLHGLHYPWGLSSNIGKTPLLDRREDLQNNTIFLEKTKTTNANTRTANLREKTRKQNNLPKGAIKFQHCEWHHLYRAG